jgi:hypothetical protein
VETRSQLTRAKIQNTRDVGISHKEHKNCCWLRRALSRAYRRDEDVAGGENFFAPFCGHHFGDPMERLDDIALEVGEGCANGPPKGGTTNSEG